MSTTTLHVAIYDDIGIFKHWSLFIDGEDEADKTELQVMGSDGWFWFEEKKNSNARDSVTLFELFYLCEVDSTKVNTVKEIARNNPVRNEISGWNCREFVLDVLDDLESEAIIDGKDKGYGKRKVELRGKQDGLA